jgi:L-ribulose-5-phosphate 4-epimerase
MRGLPGQIPNLNGKLVQLMSEDVRELVATASRILAAAGQGDLIWGHASARDPGGRGVWLKAARWGLEEITADRVHLVTEDGEVAAGEGQRHSEYPIHTEIMNARPDVGAVVHTHPPHAVALGATGQPLRPVSHAANYFAPDVPRFTLTADLIRTRALGKEVAAALGAAPAVLLVNHGIVTVGKSMQTATVAAVLLERACQQQMLTHAFGGWPTWSGSEESSAKQQKIYADDRMQAVWEYLARSLDG